jgi:type I restriction enzyme S subunit/type I restriction enzyme M protein
LQRRPQALGAISLTITDGDHGSADYQDKGVAFVLSENVKEGWIDTSSLRFISPEYHKTLPRSRLRPGDILVTKTGVYFGRSAVVPDTFVEANTIAHVGIVRLKPGFDARYVSTFLNSKYGYSQLRRRGIKATRPEIKLVEFADIEVVFFSSTLEKAIHRVLNAATSERQSGLEDLAQLEQRLIASLGLADWTPPEPLTYIRTLSNLRAAGRWDSQFHLPHVDAYLDRLANRFELRSMGSLGEVTNGESVQYSESGLTPIIRSGDLVDLDDENRFLRAADGQPFFKLEKGDVLISSIGFGSIGKVQVFDKADNFGTVSEVTVVRQKYLDPYFLAAFLRSKSGQVQIERWITGATGQLHLYPRDVKRIMVPLGDEALQRSMRQGAENVRRARLKAGQLLGAAKRAVEIAIEQGETAALRFLDETGR